MRIKLTFLSILFVIFGFAAFVSFQNAEAAGSGDFTFNIYMNEKKCQLAVWVENDKGEFIDTVYISRKTAQKGLGNRKGELDDMMGGARLSMLPVWAHRRGVDYGGGNYYPPKNKPLPDAVTSASPDAGKFVREWKPSEKLKPGKYYFYVEVNESFDDNGHHDYSWYRGQPSVVWKGEIIVGKKASAGSAATGMAKIIGHGHIAGADGSINPDVSTLTTALKLIDKAEVVYRPGK